MDKEKIKQKIQESMTYLDATTGITDRDNDNIDFTKDLLTEILEELEDEQSESTLQN